MASLHILLSGTDQFITNIFLHNGKLNQVLRDIGLMVPDLLHLTLPIIEYMKNDDTGTMVIYSNGKESTISKNNKIQFDVLIKYCVFVCFLWLIGNNL